MENRCFTRFNNTGETTFGSSPHTHPNYEFQFILEGEGTFKVNSRSYLLKKNTFFVIPPNTSHYFKSPGGLRQWIFFGTQNIFSSWPDLEMELNNSIVQIKLDSSFLHEYERIKGDSLSAIPEKQEGAFYFILSLLLRRSANRIETHSNYVMKARKMLEETIENRMGAADAQELGLKSIRQIAEELGISQAYLIQLFKKEIGVPPKAYRQKYKIDRSCYYLMNPEITICEAAEKSGFQDPYYFSRLFKKITGSSPSDWRRKNTIAYSGTPGVSIPSSS